MQTLNYPQVQETLYKEVLDNGLEVIVLPKKGFNKTYATFATKYGSVDNHFSVGDEKADKVPDGIAHFLEHKMFEEPSGDIFAVFASQGASANAYTSFDRTVYLFSATEQINENIETLINFVQNPYFTDASVEKEKGIIAQEINMYRDNADWRVYYGLIDAMYHNYPIYIDIAGTVESINQIDKETLYRCYETFYHPSNMLLFVVGNVDAEEVFKLVRGNQAAKNFERQGDIKRYFESEPETIKLPRKVTELPVSLPKCMLGFKEKNTGLTGQQMLRQELTSRLMLDSLIGQSSPLYQKLYEQNLISDSFGHEYNISQYYGFSVIGGDTPDPDALIEEIRTSVEAMLQTEIDSVTFERTKRKKIGSYLRMLNSPEAIASEFTKYRFHGCDMFDILSIYESCTLQQVNDRLREHFDFRQLAVSIVKQHQQ